MTFDQLVLHNFGPFLGRNVIELAPPNPGRPIVLFGGLNGAGKTTLLDALQLVLYGKNARCTNRNGRSYGDYLQACINRSIAPSEGAALELSFRRIVEGKEARYRLHRSWAASESGLRERFEVLRDDHIDRLHTDNWEESVEEFIPSRLSQLFFFDGEKIEVLADLENSASVLETAVQGLLGLDLIDQLSADLVALRRRKKQGLRSTVELEQIENIRKDLSSLEQNRRRLNDQKAAAQNEVDTLVKSLQGIEELYKRQGGDLQEQRGDIENQKEFLEAQLSETEARLRELAADAVPLLLVTKQLAAVEEQGLAEAESRETALVVKVLQERDSWLLDEVRRRLVPANAVHIIDTLLHEDRNERSKAAPGERPYLSLSPESLATVRMLRENRLGELSSLALRLLDDHTKLRETLTELERKLAAMPAPDAVAGILEWRSRVRADLHRAQARLDHLKAEHETAVRAVEHKEKALAAALDKQVHADQERSDAQRLINHSEIVDRTLQKLRTAVVARDIERIEQLVLDSFQQLVRKKALVTKIVIDQRDFSVKLLDRDGRALPPDRLSAGERQLLAVSLLWGLARASGRPIPTVIDTPLGRLDSVHRRHLIRRYFPSASHQVVLLSTDEEIDEQNYHLLKSAVGRAYHLQFDDATQSTHVTAGYFWNGGGDGH